LLSLRAVGTVTEHQNIYTYTWTAPYGKTHSENDHVLIHRIVLDVRCSTLADCDNDHRLVVESVRESRPANKQEQRGMNMERFKLKKIDYLENTKVVRFKSLKNSQVSNNIKYIRDFCKTENVLREGYQPRIHFLNGKKAYLLADSYGILKRRKYYFSVFECTWKL